MKKYELQQHIQIIDNNGIQTEDFEINNSPDAIENSLDRHIEEAKELILRAMGAKPKGHHWEKGELYHMSILIGIKIDPTVFNLACYGLIIEKRLVVRD